MKPEIIKSALEVKAGMKNGGNRRKLLAESTIHAEATEFVQSLVKTITEGSEKEILWAEKIRAENFSRLVREYSLFLYETALVEAGEMQESQFKKDLVDICIRNTRAGFGSHRASDIISSRDSIMLVC